MEHLKFHMNNSKTLLIGAVIFVIAIIAVYTLTQKSDSSMERTDMTKDSVMMADDATTTPAVVDDSKAMMNSDQTETAMMKQSSAYLPYTAQALSQTAGNRRVLFFYASWCPTCIPADAEFAANLGKIPSDVSVIRVNYNDPETDTEEKALAQKYGVTYQHTYVQIDAAGEKVAAWNGGAVDELLANIK